jgi:predicted homoserine dehydrogenase-like protein
MNGFEPGMSVDSAMVQREAEGRPVRVGIVGAGATGRAIALQLGTPVTGMRLVAIANRTLANAERALREAGYTEWRVASTAADVDAAAARGIPVLAESASALIESRSVDVIVEVTGTIDYAARVVLDAIERRKHVVIVNAELDSLLGPILKARADAAGVVLTNTDGDEPGVAMTLLRYLRACGMRPVAVGNIKGMVDHYRTPDTQRAFAAQWDQDPQKVTSFADATKLSMEAAVVANATGFHVGRRGMYGPACKEVREIADLLPAEDMLAHGLVDYALGAAPHTGAFVVVHETAPLKQAQLRYYKLGQGPFYVFYTPFHLPHIQVASTIARAAIHGDPTVAPLGGPVCEVVSVAKRDLEVGERLDGIGGFCTYGLIENSSDASRQRALPIGLSEGCVMTRRVPRDGVVTFDDVTMPPPRLSDELWHEQHARWTSNARSIPIEAATTRAGGRR